MCLILLYYEPQSNNRLIVISNRDEFFDRSTEPAHYWSAEHIISSTNDEKPLPSVTILAGRDGVGGGSWLGIDPKRNRFAAVTNFRMGVDTCRNSVVVSKVNNQSQSSACSGRRKRSRGSLPIDFLISDMDSIAFLRQSHITDRSVFDGFNMLAFDGNTLAYVSNRGGGPPKELAGGIYGLCNGLLDDPWPKVVKGKHMLELAMHENILSPLESGSLDVDLHVSLLDIMLDTDRPPDDMLPNTGIPIELERGLSSIYVELPSIGYGTRSSALVVMDEDGTQLFVEREYRRRDEEDKNGEGGDWKDGGDEQKAGGRSNTCTVVFRDFAN